jgi:hypothetical protein
MRTTVMPARLPVEQYAYADGLVARVLDGLPRCRGGALKET